MSISGNWYNEGSRELIPSRNISGRFSCAEISRAGSSRDEGGSRRSDGQTIQRRLMVDAGWINDGECPKVAPSRSTANVC